MLTTRFLSSASLGFLYHCIAKVLIESRGVWTDVLQSKKLHAYLRPIVKQYRACRIAWEHFMTPSDEKSTVKQPSGGLGPRGTPHVCNCCSDVHAIAVCMLLMCCTSLKIGLSSDLLRKYLQ